MPKIAQGKTPEQLADVDQGWKVVAKMTTERNQLELVRTRSLGGVGRALPDLSGIVNSNLNRTSKIKARLSPIYLVSSNPLGS